MKKNEKIVLASVFVIFAVAGYLDKAADRSKIVALETELRVTKFKTRVYRHSFEAALEQVPDDRVKIVREKIDSDIKFEQITADQH